MDSHAYQYDQRPCGLRDSTLGLHERYRKTHEHCRCSAPQKRKVEAELTRRITLVHMMQRYKPIFINDICDGKIFYNLLQNYILRLTKFR